MKRYKPLFEKRRNPDQNPHVGAWDYVEMYKDNYDIYISFTKIDKIGINPRSRYNTPIGIYTYPLKEFVKKYLSGIKVKNDYVIGEDKYKYETDIGDYAPFAGDAKYINFLKLTDKSNFVEDIYKDYGSVDYDRDIEILRKKYSKSFTIKDIDKMLNEIIKAIPKNMIISGIREMNDFEKSLIKVFKKYSENYGENITFIQEFADFIGYWLDEEIPMKELKLKIKDYIQSLLGNKFEDIVEEGINTAKDKNPVMSMWNITRLLAQELSNSEKQQATKWNMILSKDLGYSGFADKSGRGYIHPAEPMQAVFLRKSAFEVLHRVENKPNKPIENPQPKFKKGQKFLNTWTDNIFEIKQIIYLKKETLYRVENLSAKNKPSSSDMNEERIEELLKNEVFKKI